MWKGGDNNNVRDLRFKADRNEYFVSLFQYTVDIMYKIKYATNDVLMNDE